METLHQTESLKQKERLSISTRMLEMRPPRLTTLYLLILILLLLSHVCPTNSVSCVFTENMVVVCVMGTVVHEMW